jgi:hypothetical protein
VTIFVCVHCGCWRASLKNKMSYGWCRYLHSCGAYSHLYSRFPFFFGKALLKFKRMNIGWCRYPRSCGPCGPCCTRHSTSGLSTTLRTSLFPWTTSSHGAQPFFSAAKIPTISTRSPPPPHQPTHLIDAIISMNPRLLHPVFLQKIC